MASRPTRAQRGLRPLKKVPIGADKLREILKPYPKLLKLLEYNQSSGDGSVYAFDYIARMKRGDATKYIRAAVLADLASNDNFWVLVKRTATVERRLKTDHGVGLLDAHQKDMKQAVRSAWAKVISKSRGHTDYSDIGPYW